MTFLQKISKLFIIYSIRYNKAIYEIHAFTYDVIEKMVTKKFDQAITLIIKKIGKLEDHKGWHDLEDLLNGDIVYNSKLKNIVCRLSAMLHENNKLKNWDSIEEIKNNIFNGNVYIDIEHIQSYNDEDESKRDTIFQEWGDDINAIGNLMVLEYDINRSLQNTSYSNKIDKYSKSVFQVVKNQGLTFKKWTIKECQNRKKQEVKKILDYLFKNRSEANST